MELEYIVGKDYILNKNDISFQGTLVYIFHDYTHPDCYLFAFNKSHGQLPSDETYFYDSSGIHGSVPEYQGFKKIVDGMPGHTFLWAYIGEVVDYASNWTYDLEEILYKLEDDVRGI